MWYSLEQCRGKRYVSTVEADSLEEAIKKAEEEGYELDDENEDEDVLISMCYYKAENEEDLYDDGCEEIDVDDYYKIIED